MDKSKFKEYAELDLQIKQLESKKANLRKELTDELVKAEAKTVKADFGTFSLVERKSWQYSDEYKQKAKQAQEKIKTFCEPINNELASLQKEEQEKGRAKVKINESLSFRAKK